MSQSQLNALERFVQLMNTNALVQAFLAAESLGVFDALSEGQRDLPALAEQCEAQPEPLRLLLDVLCAVGVVEQYGEDYALAPVMHLLPPPQRDLGNEYWQHLTKFVATGESLPQMEGVATTEEDYRAHRLAAQWMFTPAALSLAKLLEIGETRRDLQILDVGAGAAVWSLTLAHHDPGAHVTAVDVPPALQAAASTADNVGLADRLTLIEGDMLEVELPEETFDLAILAGVVSLEASARSRSMLQRIAGSLKRGGELAVIDAFPGQEKGKLSQSLFALTLALRTESGRTVPASELQRWLLDAGFEKPNYAHLPMPPYTMGAVLARKPD